MTQDVLARVDRQAVTVSDMADLVARVRTHLEARRGFTLFTLNLDHLVKRRRNAAFRAAYQRATFVTADGWPIVRLARRAAPDLRRTTGADLVVPLCHLAAEMAVPVALFGSQAVILARAASRLRARCPGLDIVHQAAPPFGFDPEGDAGHAAMTAIGASGARLCFVALGAPKQEVFADHAREACPATGFVCIGAALDFIAGAHRRAPISIRRVGLEWAWRLVLQPRRLGLRYVECAVLFARLSLAGEGATRVRS